MEEEKTQAIVYATKQIAIIREDKLVNEAARIMSEKGISQMPVVNERKETIGAIKEKTILTKLLQDGQEVLNYKVESIMEAKIPEMPISTNLEEAKKMVLEYDAILIMEEEKIVGILTKIDIIKAYSDKILYE